ncbi:sensor domain-containing diguanylate cyclase [Pseudomonas delhiensis]|uniref:GGDEF domain-containing protein n=1 Tax=Pseudomonas delhiensis TaxID=366289 RepID=UPI003159C0FA
MSLGPMPRLNLRTLILLFASLAAIATLANDLFTTYRIQREALVLSALEHNRAYAAKVALSISQSLASSLDRLAYSATLLGQDFADAAVRDAEVERLARQDGSFNTVVIADASGRILTAVPRWLGANGRKILSRRPLEERQAMISPAFHSQSGERVVFVSQPVWNARGDYLGLVGGTIYLNRTNSLNHIVSRHFQEDTSFVYLVDEQRQLLYHPQRERIGQTVGPNTAVDAALRGESGALQIVNTLGLEVLAGYAAVPDSGWGVVSQQPLSVTLGAVRTLMLQVLAGIVPMILLGFPLLWWIAARISHPLRRLADYAAQLDNTERIEEVRAWYFEAWRIRRALIIGGRMTQERIGQLNRQAQSDPLTGLANRRALEATLASWVARGEPFAVISMDIDHFKQVNDSFGHAAGDQVLQAFAEVLRCNSRSGDLPCRAGGEEFILLLPGTSLGVAAEVAERIRLSTEQTAFPRVGRVTLSLGVAFSSEGRTDADAVLAAADTLLYQAKQAGRNRVVVADERPAGVAQPHPS